MEASKPNVSLEPCEVVVVVGGGGGGRDLTAQNKTLKTVGNQWKGMRSSLVRSDSEWGIF